MAHEHHDDARKSHGDKLARMTGQRGEYPPDRAARIAGVPSIGGQGDSTLILDADQFTNAPARQVSNTGEVRK